ncbi:MAG: hypothetical protein ACI4R8_03570 [Candidatus Caccovivens sp.]
MNYLYLFDLVDFDVNGDVCATKRCDLKQAQQNYLYLVSKYNQNLLKEQNLPLSTFFKEDLQNVLKMPYSFARKEVFANCLPEVEGLSNLSDRDVILSLSENAKFADEKFACKVNTALEKAINNLNIEYILTSFSGKKYDEITSMMSNDYSEPAVKSKLFKDVIAYNSLVNLATNVNINDMNFSTANALI